MENESVLAVIVEEDCIEHHHPIYGGGYFFTEDAIINLYTEGTVNGLLDDAKYLFSECESIQRIATEAIKNRDDIATELEKVKNDLLFLAEYVWCSSRQLPMPNYLALERYPLDVAKKVIEKSKEK